MRLSVLMICLMTVLPGGCGRDDTPSPTIAVSSSYIECAVRDLLGENAGIIRLAEPGMCPGHFDLRPSQVRQLQACRALLRFEFQSALDRQAGPAGGIAITPIAIAGGMCEPENYVRTCEQASAALILAGFLSAEGAETRLAGIRQRVESHSANLTQRVAALRGMAVICSARQAAFCRWLGLNVVATIGGADGESIRRVDQALALAKEANCTLVIANRPEGTQLAEAIAARLGGRMVVFDNFPDLGERQRTFDGLLSDNVQRLLDAVNP